MRWMMLAFLLLLPSLAAGQSLAEAARKEKERRKRIREAGVEARVITEQDLKKAPGALANDPKEPAAVESSSARRENLPEASASSELEDRDSQKELWHTRAAKARARIDKARSVYEALSSLQMSPGDFFVDDAGKVVIRSLEHLRQLLSQAKAELDAAEEALEQLEEAARRSNVPPGWLREP